jgi:outer membrane immunogenic protein
MKKLLLASITAVAFCSAPALAADMAVKAPAKAPAYQAVAPVFNWTGCYLGAQAGYAWGHTGYDLEIPPDANSGFNFNVKGGVAGGHLGCNYQINQFVLGIEGDGEWTGIKGDDNDRGGTTDKISGNWQASIRARAGMAFDRYLVYATGGGAWMNVTYSKPDFNSETVHETLKGWTAGAGVEYAFYNNWTMRAEYRYARFNSEGFAFNTGTDRTLRETTTNTGRIGVTYKF